MMAVLQINLEKLDSSTRRVLRSVCQQRFDGERLGLLGARPLAMIKMADVKKVKKRGKQDENQDFLVIRAKGQFLKLPKEDNNAEALMLSDTERFKSKVGKRKRSRKNLRKSARTKKKAKKLAYFTSKKENKAKAPQEQSKIKGTEEDSEKDLQSETPKEKVKKKKRKRKRSSSLSSRQAEIQRLKEANKGEEKEIGKMERLLRVRKNKLPSQFRSEGLDYLLDVCEPLAKRADVEDSKDEMNIALWKKPTEKQKVIAKSYEPDEASDFETDDSYEPDTDDDDDGDDERLPADENVDEDLEDMEEDEEEDNEKQNRVEEEEEDETGDEIVRTDDDSEREESKGATGTQKYVPPHLRKTDSSEAHKEMLLRIKRQMKGQFNRLSEGNLQSISGEVEQAFMQHSRNDMNEVLFELILDSCVSVSAMPDKLVMEHVMLLCILHNHMGTEVGAFFLQKLADKFNELHTGETYGEGKQCLNVVALFAHMYNFKLIHCSLIYDIIRRLAENFREQDIELLLLLLKTTGAEIRRDDPGSLKEIILQIQAKAASASEATSQSRMRFMLEIISNLRNNNLRKIPGYDPSTVERLRKVLRAAMRDPHRGADSQLKISLQDLLEADKKGRWWIVGSAWSGRQQDEAASMATSSLVENSKLMEIARHQRISTDVRKSIFCVMMTSEDYIDAFDKLLRLKLKDVQAREIVHVLIDSCLQEKQYNPFYAYLGQKFCEYNRSYQVTFQYSFWDKFKIISELSPNSVTNMAQLLCHLLATRSLSLAILKVVNFAEHDKPSIQFFRQLFTRLLVDYPLDTLRNIFERISPLQELDSLRQSLWIFIKHFLKNKKSIKDLKSQRKDDFKEKLRIVETALRESDAVKL